MKAAFGILGGLLGIVVIVGMCADPIRLIDPPSLLVVILPSLLLLVSTFEPASIQQAFTAAVRGTTLALEPLRVSTLILSELIRLLSAAGIIGTFIGFVLMLSDMSDPSAIGPAFAVALLPTFYALILGGLVVAPLRARLRIQSKVSTDTVAELE